MLEVTTLPMDMHLIKEPDLWGGKGWKDKETRGWMYGAKKGCAHFMLWRPWPSQQHLKEQLWPWMKVGILHSIPQP